MLNYGDACDVVYGLDAAKDPVTEMALRLEKIQGDVTRGERTRLLLEVAMLATAWTTTLMDDEDPRQEHLNSTVRRLEAAQGRTRTLRAAKARGEEV